jgi:hypothetical protein
MFPEILNGFSAEHVAQRPVVLTYVVDHAMASLSREDILMH